MDTVKITDQLLNKIKENEIRLIEKIVGSSVSSFEEYKGYIGELKGLVRAKQDLLEIIKGAENGDDDEE